MKSPGCASYLAGRDQSRFVLILESTLMLRFVSGERALPPFFAQFDGPIWPVVVGVILILVLTVIGVFDNWFGTLVGCVLGFGALLGWCWDLFWPKPK